MNPQSTPCVAPQNRSRGGSSISLVVALFSLFAHPASAAVGATLTPTTTSTASTTPVVLLVTGLTPGETINVERCVDANANGVIAPPEFLAASFSVTDGQVSSIGGVRNLNVPGDEDLAADGQISVNLTPASGPELGRLAGAQLVRISSPTSAFAPFTCSLTVTLPAQAQSISGTVTDGTDPVPYASVALLDATTDGEFAGGIVADVNGQFTLPAPVGSYQVVAFKRGYLTNFGASPTVALGAGQTPTQNLVVVPATTFISGKVADAGNDAGLGGVQLFVQSESGLATVISSNPDGTYTAPVTADQWQIEVSDISLGALGYLNFNNASVGADTSSAAAPGVNINLPKATALIYGTVKDNANNPLNGIELVATNQGTLYGEGRSYTPNANYAIAVTAGTWSVNVPEDNVPPGYTAGTIPNVTLNAGQAMPADVVLNAVTAHLRGHVQDDSGAPIANMTLVVQKYPIISDGTGSRYPMTDASGNFDVGVNANTWNVALECEETTARQLVDQHNYNYVVVDGVDQNGLLLTFQRATGTISGTVKDALNNPIPGVHVDANITGNGVPYNSGCIETDANGSYTLQVLNNTSWHVSPRSSDLNNHGFNGVTPQTAVVSSGTGTANFVASLLSSDVTPPALAASTPANGATNVALNSTVSFTFNEPMQAGYSITWSNNVTANQFSYVWSGGGQTLTCTYNTALPASATISWTLNPTGGAQNFHDTAGNALPGDLTGSFTTASNSNVSPAITTEPANQTVNAGQNAMFTVAASGNPAPTFQWELSTDNGYNWSTLADDSTYSGVTTATLTVNAVTLGQNLYRYRALATNSSGSVSTVHAILTVNPVSATDNNIVTWGINDARTIIPAGIGNATAIAASGDLSVALKGDGTVAVWGVNLFNGQTDIPAAATGVTAISAGIAHIVVLKNDGTVVAWGYNVQGQADVPVGLSGVTAIAAGDFHTMALKSDGTVVAWGFNAQGQTTIPAGLTGVTAIAAGMYHSVALKSDGTVVAWGFNDFGQATVPAGLTGVTAIAAGQYHTLALKSDGTVVTWGSNAQGQCSIPAGLSGVTAIAAGDLFSMALKGDGSVVVWGDNEYGQTVLPAGLSGVSAIAGGAHHVAVLTGLIPPPRPALFDALGYLAHNGDVAAGIGDVPDKLDQAWRHYYLYGSGEGRTDGEFNVQAYLAQYPNLAAIYGSNLRGAALYWYTTGRKNGDRIPAGFSVAGYFLRNSDIAAIFANDKYGAWLHYYNYGVFEGRSYDANFIVDEYLELNPDLKGSFGSNKREALMHWLVYGHPLEDRMGRVPIGFNVDSYLARYPDLQAVFGGITPTAVRNVTVWHHYIDYGTLEGRSDGDFEAYNYLATNPDLAAVYGSDIRGAALHWYFYGRREGRRIPGGFDVQDYRTRYPDIVVGLGDDLYGAWLHYRDTGVNEGRVFGNVFRPVDYLALNPDVAAVVGATNYRDALLHWLYYGQFEGRQGKF